MNNIVDNIRGMNPYKADRPTSNAPYSYGWNECCDAFAKQLSSIQSAGVWRKASDVKIEFKKTYFAKRVFDDGGEIMGTGRFQESDGVFFWREQGYVPVSLNQHATLLLLDPTPIPVPGEGSEDQENLWTEALTLFTQMPYMGDTKVQIMAEKFTITRNTINNAKQ